MAWRAGSGGHVAVGIMAKAPRAGGVKTRLCPPLRPEKAAALYRCFLLDKIEQVRALAGAIPIIAYSPADERPAFEAMAPDFALVPQRGDDLGDRLLHAFDDVLAGGHAGALMTDADSPTLPVTFLEQAVRLLETPEVDLVLGPTEDGGYYLIGLRAPRAELLRDMPWSTPAVFAETLRRAGPLGLRVSCLPTWFDVDTAADLARLRLEIGTGAGPMARHTREFLAREPLVDDPSSK